MHSGQPPAGGVEQEGGIGELARHQLAQRKQGLFEPLQEQGQPEQDVQEAQQHPAQVRNRPAQDEDLEPEQRQRDRRHVTQGLQQDVEQAAHPTSIP